MTSSAEPALECEDLLVGYAGKAVAPAVSLKVQPGQVLAVVGRNGAGKTTLLKTMLGLVPAVQGYVLLGGREVASLPRRERARLVAYVPQREGAGLDMTARDYVLTGRFAHSRGVWEDAEDREAVKRVLAWASVGGSGRVLSAYSGGERQRLGLARALAQGAPLVLMDEPTTHLDPWQKRKLAETVLGLAGSGHAVVVVSHDVAWCQSVAPTALAITREAAETVATESLGEPGWSEKVFGP